LLPGKCLLAKYSCECALLVLLPPRS
jgi:hypothetical protein